MWVVSMNLALAEGRRLMRHMRGEAGPLMRAQTHVDSQLGKQA
jgi:hypothetical protein